MVDKYYNIIVDRYTDRQEDRDKYELCDLHGVMVSFLIFVFPQICFPELIVATCVKLWERYKKSVSLSKMFPGKEA